MDTSRAYEEAYLNTVLEKLRQRIRVLEDKTRVGQQNLSDAGFKLWDEITHVIRDFDDVAALTLYDADITRQEDEHRSALIELRNMLSLYQIPYFGRLDFVSDFDGEKEQVYIGAHAFMDRKSFMPYVYDWRTPIASMYYDSEIGPASFLSPGGEETGEITLMRRYRIRGGKLEFMYDAATGDDMLGYVLSENAQARLKVIVESIQKEQNRVIRDEGRGDLVIFGPAGSGKTSVGIHRFAYLLYRFRDHLSNKNFVILSRNGMFSSYIGDILPELGEEDAKCVIFDDILLPLADPKYRFPSYQEQLDYLATAQSGEKRLTGIRIKTSFSFLDRILDYFEKHRFDMPDIEAFGEILMTREDFTQRCNTMHASRPFAAVLGYARDCVKTILDAYFERNSGEIRKALSKQSETRFPDELDEAFLRIQRGAYENAYAYINRNNARTPEEIYLDLLRAEFEAQGESLAAYTQTVKNLESGRPEYEDVLALALIRALSGELTPSTQIQQVLLDEAQDYSPLHHTLLRMCYPRAAFTVLADVNQNVFPYVGIEKEEDFSRLYPGHRVSRLTRSYRSTGPINELAAGFIHSDSFDYFSRSGETPCLIRCEDAAQAVKSLLESGFAEGMQSVGVICPSLKAAKKLSGRIGDMATLYEDPDKNLQRGVIVMPAAYTKGLEFDAVIALCPEDIGANMLYLLCTRALHKLALVCEGGVPPLLKKAGDKLTEVSPLAK